MIRGEPKAEAFEHGPVRQTVHYMVFMVDTHDAAAHSHRVATIQVALRLETKLVADVDRMVEAMAKRTAGVKATRAAVLKEAIVRGLRQMTAELEREGGARRR